MKLLAIETSGSACSVALLNENKVTAQQQIAPMQQTKLILPMIQAVLADANLDLSQLDAIAYGCGPGSFTGIRIASSVAKGLAFAVDKPVIEVSSLAILAQAAYLEQKWEQICVALDARMNQIYWAMYTLDQTSQMALLGTEQVCLVTELKIPAELRTKGVWYGIGDAWDKYPEKLVEQIRFMPQSIKASQQPLGEAVLQLARVKFNHGECMTAGNAAPVYLR